MKHGVFKKHRFKQIQLFKFSIYINHFFVLLIIIVQHTNCKAG